MLPLLVVLLACKSDTAVKDPPGPSEQAYVPPVLPVLTVTSPERGSFTGSERVVVEGQVLAGDAAVASVAVNGEAIGFDGGRKPGGTASFRADHDWTPGINIIGVRVDDEGGERAVDGRAVYAGPVHKPGETLDGALRLQLGPELLDDDHEDVDDLARIAEIIMGDPSIADGIVGTPMESDYFVLTPTSLDWLDAAVDLVAGDGTLRATITLYDVWMDFEIGGTGWYSWVSTTGAAWVDAAILDMTLAVSSSGGHVSVTPTSTSANLDGYGITVDWFPDSLEGYLADWTEETLEEQIAGTTEEMVGDLLAEYLEAFVTDVEIASGITLELAMDALEVATDGLRLTLDVGVSAVAGLDLPVGAGSLETSGAAPAWPLTTAEPFGVACDDDFVNQLLFAFWSTGQLSGLEFSGTEIGGMSGAALPEPIAPVSSVALSLDLPPVIGAATQDDMDADLSLGEFRLTFNREDGEVNDFSVNVRTGLTVALQDDGTIAMALDGRPSLMTLEIGTLRYPAALDPGDLAALVRLMVPPLLTNASTFLPAFAVPGIPLDSFSDAPELAGKELVLTDPSLVVDSGGGWVVLTAGLAAD